jgi:hypothetical protein
MSATCSDIPAELTESDCWVGTKGKRPVYPEAQWKTADGYATTSFEKAQNAPRTDNVGVILTPSAEIICLDFDSVVSPEGEIHETVGQILDRLPEDTYLELSTSGTGIHALVRADGLCDGKKDTLYFDEWDGSEERPHLDLLGVQQAKNLVLTGNTLAGMEIPSVPDVLHDVHSRFPDSSDEYDRPDPKPSCGNGSVSFADLNDSNARTAEGTLKTLEQFAEYGSGEVKEHCEKALTLLSAEPEPNPDCTAPEVMIDGVTYNSPSNVDLHVCAQLAYITGENEAVIWEIISDSARAERPKKNKSEGYWVRTIRTACATNQRTMSDQNYCE